MIQHFKRSALFGAAIVLSSTAVRADSRALGGGLDQLVRAYEEGSPTLGVALTLHLRDRNGDPLVRFKLADGTALKDVLPQLNAVGFRLVAQSIQDPRLVEGYLPLSSARYSLTLPGVTTAHAVHVPAKRVGAVTSQAVTFEKANRAQGRGFDGTGIRVGALSDSFDACTGCLTHAAGDVATGDLPANVTVLEDLPPGGGEDEGRAMLQLIHDLAPGSQLGFATAFVSELDFANNIIDLRLAFHADVITDDVFYFDEPFFSDGLLAQAVDLVSASGAAYFSSAGNDGVEAYEADYSAVSFARAEALTAQGRQNIQVDQIPPELRPISFHNFGNPDGSVNLTNRYTDAADAIVDFQWDEPFNLGKVKTDYNIYLFDARGNFVDPDPNVNGGIAFYTTDDNVQTDQAIELLEVVPEPGEIHGAANFSDYQIVIGKMNNGPARHFKYITENSLGVSRLQGAPSVVGHAAASGGQAVGAVYYAIPNFPEDFSSGGPTTILFDVNGNRLRHPDVRQTPQIVAADGVDTTFFIGGDPDATGFPNFFGTSAAAPDAAGVAALMLQAAGGPGRLKPAKLYKKLQDTATPMRLANNRNSAFAFSGPVAFVAKGDWVRSFHFWNVAVQPFFPSSIKSISFDVTNTPSGLTFNTNPNRFSVAPSSDVTQSQITYTVSADAHTITLTFAPGSFGAGKQLSFGTSVFTPIQGSTQEDPDRLVNTKVTVTDAAGHSFTGRVFADEAEENNRFTNNGLVNADEAVRAVQRGGDKD
jgi:hypothetical protein